AAVDLEPDVEGLVQGFEHRERLRRIEDQPQGDPAGELPYLVEAGADDREGPGDVGEAVVGEDPRLIEGRHGDAGRSQGALAPGDLGRLVGLDVGAQGDAEVGRALGHAAQVRLEHVEVEDQRGGGDVVDRDHKATRSGGRTS